MDIPASDDVEGRDAASHPAGGHLRASGGMKSSLFIIGVELSERLAYYAIQSNLLNYLIQVLQESSTAAIKNVTIWTGVTLVVPILGGFIADAYWGRYWTIAILTLVYLLGLLLLTLSVSIPHLKPRRCEAAITGSGGCPRPRAYQVGFFYFSLYLVSLGTGGIKPCLEAFGADQFDDDDPEERKSRSSFFNWWYFALCVGGLLAVTLLVYVETNWSWALGFGIPTAVMAMGCLLFFSGTRLYCRQLPGGSPLTQVAQVVVAAIRNIKAELPLDPRHLHEIYRDPAVPSPSRQLEHTNNMRFLDKAAVKQSSLSSPSSSWRLCTVTQVEEVKLVARVAPVWLTTFTYGVMVAQTSTVYVSQVGTMKTALGGGGFHIPAASFQAFMAVTVLVLLPIYDRLLVPAMRRWTGNERGITPLQRIGVGLCFSVLSVVAAAIVDERRLRVAAAAGLLDNPAKLTLPISGFWTLPQFILMGVADVFTLVGQQEFFYDQVPDSMRSLGMALYLSANGVGYFVSTLIQSTVNWVSTRNGGSPWIQPYSVNRSHYDYLFWVLAVLSSLNLLAFLLVASSYRYKRVKSPHHASFHTSGGLSLKDSLQRIHHRPSNASLSSTSSQ